MNGELLVVDDVPDAFAALIAREVSERTRERFSIALCGGSTGKACYERIASLPPGDLAWGSLDLYWGDERCVPFEDPDSNARMATEVLIGTLGPPGSVHPMRCDEGADAYQRALEGVTLDVVHLGMGPDGHTASLFPSSPALSAPAGTLVALNHDPSGRNPHPRMTLTFEGISRARHVIITVSGEGKRQAMESVRSGEPLPAGLVTAAEVTWLVDRAALPSA